MDITELQLGHSIHVRDIPTPAGVQVLNSPDQVVCTIAHKRVEVAEAAEEVEVEALEGAAAEEEPAEEQAEE